VVAVDRVGNFRPFLGVLAIAMSILAPGLGAVAAEFTVKPGSNVNTRSGPGTGFDRLGMLRGGVKLEELERQGEWSKVRTETGNVVWVHNGYLTSVAGAARAPAAAKGLQVVAQSGHAGSVRTSSFSRDSRLLATASEDLTVKLWDVASGRLMRTFRGHRHWVSAAAFSPDSMMIASAAYDGTVRIWDVRTGRAIRTLSRAQTQIHTAEFSTDGTLLASAREDGEIDIWRVADGKLLKTLKLHRAGVTQAVFLRDGRTLVSGGRDGRVIVVNFSTGKVIGRVNTGTPIWSIALSQDHSAVFARGEDGHVRQWSLKNGKLLGDYALTSGPDEGPATELFRSIGVSGRSLYCLRDNKIFHFDIGNTTPTWVAPIPVDKSTIPLHVLTNTDTMAVAPNGEYLFLGGSVAANQIWRVRDRAAHATLAGKVIYVRDIRFREDSSQFAMTGHGPITTNLAVWDAKTGAQRAAHDGDNFLDETILTGVKQGFVRATGTTRDSTASGSEDTTIVEFLDLKDADERAAAAQDPFHRRRTVIPGSSYSDIRKLFSSPQGAFIKFSNKDHLKIVDHGRISSLYIQTNTKKEDLDVTGITENRNGTYFFVTENQYDEKSKSYLYDSEKRQLIGDLKVGNRAGIKISPTGGRLAVISADPKQVAGQVAIYDFSGRRLADLATNGGEVTDMAYSDDGRHLAVLEGGGLVSVFDTESNSKVGELRIESGLVSIDIHAHGTILSVRHHDGGVSLWDIAAGKKMVTLYGFVGNEWLAITPEGFFASSGSGHRFLAIVNGTEVIAAGQAFDALYRPDLVREALAGDPEGKVRDAAAKLDLAKVIDSGSPPELTDIRFAGMSDRTTSDRADLQMTIAPRGGGIGRVEIRVNGATQIIEDLPADGTDPVSISQSVFLTPGKNQVNVVVYNKANLIASSERSVVIESTARMSGTPTLRVLAVGINRYLDERLQLTYAVSDASAVADAVRKAGSQLYKDVDVTTVLDADATVENLEQVFKQIGSRTRPEDVFVFFLAGHGKTYDGRYYFLPHEFQFKGVDSFEESGVGQHLWQRWMSYIPAQKSVLLYDTCESGSLARDQENGGLELDSAVGRLTHATGRTIMTAATDTGPALEGYGGHGMFSYVVLEAIGVADTDRDGQLEVSELAGYIKDQLPELSFRIFKHRQNPIVDIKGYSFSLGAPAIVLTSKQENASPGTETAPERPQQQAALAPAQSASAGASPQTEPAPSPQATGTEARAATYFVISRSGEPTSLRQLTGSHVFFLGGAPSDPHDMRMLFFNAKAPLSLVLSEVEWATTVFTKPTAGKSSPLYIVSPDPALARRALDRLKTLKPGATFTLTELPATLAEPSPPSSQAAPAPSRQGAAPSAAGLFVVSAEPRAETVHALDGSRVCVVDQSPDSGSAIQKHLAKVKVAPAVVTHVDPADWRTSPHWCHYIVMNSKELTARILAETQAMNPKLSYTSYDLPRD